MISTIIWYNHNCNLFKYYKNTQYGLWSDNWYNWSMFRPTLKSWRVRTTGWALPTRSHNKFQREGLWHYIKKQIKQLHHSNHLGVATKTATKPKPAALPGWREGRASGGETNFFGGGKSYFQKKYVFHGHDVRQSWNWVALIELVARLTLLNQYLIFSRIEIQSFETLDNVIKTFNWYAQLAKL